MAKRVFDDKTGEVDPVGYFVDSQEQRERRRKYWESQNATEMRRSNHDPWSKFYMASCREDLFSDLSPQNTARLVYAASHMGYDSILRMTERSKMTFPEFESLMREQLSPATFNRFWKAVKDRYIFLQGDGTLLVKGGFYRGKQNSTSERLTKIFIQKLQDLYRRTKVTQHRNLGYIFKLLSCVNIQFNVLCDNPEETDWNRVQPITMKQFCQKIHYDESKMARLMEVYRTITFEVNGRQQYFCAFVTTGRNTNNPYIIINPRIFYAGSCADRVDFYGLFFNVANQNDTKLDISDFEKQMG